MDIESKLALVVESLQILLAQASRLHEYDQLRATLDMDESPSETVLVGRVTGIKIHSGEFHVSMVCDGVERVYHVGSNHEIPQERDSLFYGSQIRVTLRGESWVSTEVL